MSVVSVVCCQVEVSEAGRSLVQRSPTLVVRRCISSRNLVNEVMANLEGGRGGLSFEKKKDM
jgi:hypothetical protein